jgi:hypothetical protein
MPEDGRGRGGRKSDGSSYPLGPASTMSCLDATSVARHETPAVHPATRTRGRKSTRGIAAATFQLRLALGLAHATVLRHACHRLVLARPETSRCRARPGAGSRRRSGAGSLVVPAWAGVVRWGIAMWKAAGDDDWQVPIAAGWRNV